jgi:hypothetical protein
VQEAAMPDIDDLIARLRARAIGLDDGDAG